ncbi:MAG TPA: hypothetical protein VE569_06775 [Acidimicrobiia bacterium]|jgi:hypothetical protein|nr:hypothetical protein [Acidimicrobiia bacterium]
MITSDTYDRLFQQLASAWETHQRLRMAGASVADLAESSKRLYNARMAMWDWHHRMD